MRNIYGWSVGSVLLGLTALLSDGAQMVLAATPDIISGLTHHWKFDETSGNQAIDSVGNNHGTLVNWSASEPKWVSGKVGGALDFGDTVALGNNNYVLTFDPIAQEKYTIAFFLKTRPDTVNINPRLVTPTDGYEGWVLINRYFNRGVGFYYDTGAHSAQDPNPPVTGEWEHYAVVYDRLAGFTRIHRDGLQVNAGIVHSAATAEPHGLWVFGHHENLIDHGLGSLLGAMDDIRIYHRLLSPEDVFALASIPEPSGLALTMLAIVVANFRRGRLPRPLRSR